MILKVKSYSAIFLIFFASAILAADDPLFTISSNQIKDIAFEAVLEQYPDIPIDNFSETNHWVIWCTSALKLELVTDVSEDFDVCHATVRYTLVDSIVKRKYLGEDGNCYSETENESIKVKVYSDHSFEVMPIGVGAGRTQHECSEEFEGWEK